MSNLILVTGASSGIGAAIALWAAERGHDLLLTARSPERLEALGQRLSAGPTAVRCMAADLSRREGVEELRLAVREQELESGPLRGLVNNAGDMREAPAFGQPLAESDALHRDQLELLYHAPRRLTEALMPDFLARGGGSVVNIVSAAGFRAFPGTAGYTAAKHAMLGWTRAAALELDGTGVGITAACPYHVATPQLARVVDAAAEASGEAPEEIRERLQQHNPGGELVHAEQVAAIAIDLLAHPRNGRVVVLDGGPPRDLNEQR